MAIYYEQQSLISFIKEHTPTINGGTTLECVERAIKNAPAADVVSKNESREINSTWAAIYAAAHEKWEKAYEQIEYTLRGVMHSVDKWLEGDELIDDEVNRAITMREKTLQIIENAKSEAAREIFEALDEMVIPEKCTDGCAFYLDMEELSKLKEKYTEDKP